MERCSSIDHVDDHCCAIELVVSDGVCVGVDGDKACSEIRIDRW